MDLKQIKAEIGEAAYSLAYRRECVKEEERLKTLYARQMQNMSQRSWPAYEALLSVPWF